MWCPMLGWAEECCWHRGGWGAGRPVSWPASWLHGRRDRGQGQAGPARPASSLFSSSSTTRRRSCGSTRGASCCDLRSLLWCDKRSALLRTEECAVAPPKECCVTNRGGVCMLRTDNVAAPNRNLAVSVEIGPFSMRIAAFWTRIRVQPARRPGRPSPQNIIPE